MVDAHLSGGEGALDKLVDGGVGHAGREGLEEHGQVGAGDDLDAGGGGRGHHGLVEGRAAHEVAENDDAVAGGGHLGDRRGELVAEGGRLVLVERHGPEGLLRAAHHLERAADALGEGSVSSEDATDHVCFSLNVGPFPSLRPLAEKNPTSLEFRINAAFIALCCRPVNWL